MYKKVIALAALMALSSFAQAETMQEFEQARAKAEDIYTLISRDPSPTSESKKVVNDIRENFRAQPINNCPYLFFWRKKFSKRASFYS